jgi:hypothetical protein
LQWTGRRYGMSLRGAGLLVRGADTRCNPLISTIGWQLKRRRVFVISHLPFDESTGDGPEAEPDPRLAARVRVR